jgi:hypothetical protein
MHGPLLAELAELADAVEDDEKDMFGMLGESSDRLTDSRLLS